MNDEETVDTSMARAEAAAQLLMEGCIHCDGEVIVLAYRGGFPAAVEIRHHDYCPFSS